MPSVERFSCRRNPANVENQIIGQLVQPPQLPLKEIRFENGRVSTLDRGQLPDPAHGQLPHITPVIVPRWISRSPARASK